MITSPEFYINMKDIPTKDSRDYSSFYANETEKIKYGLNVNGVYIHGWLYWHINMWKLYRDILDPIDKSVVRQFLSPQLRDTEWLIAEKLKQAEDEKKGLNIIGARRLGKTAFISSYIGRSATIYQGSENVIVGNNKDDISVITSLTEKGLSALPEYYRFGRINDDWSKEVTLGFKDRKGNRDEWSKIFIRNTNNGNLTEVVAGTTPKSLIFDEIGKSPISEALAAAIPAFTSPYGWRACPVLLGTGGDFENGQDAQRMFDDPDTYNMVSMILPKEGNKKTGVFIPGTWSLEFEKEEKTLAEFTNTKKGSELDNIKILVSTEEKNTEFILNRRKELEKAKDGKELLKYKMYYPLTSDECFLTDTGNDFPIEAAMKQLDLIMRKEELQGTPIKLERDPITNKLCQYELPKNKVIWDYPHENGQNLDAPIVIYEKPIDNPPLHLYVAGCLLPGEKVLTDKGHMNIEDIDYTCKLINNDGNYVNIKALLRYNKKQEDIYTLKMSNTFRTTSFTKEHPIYSSKNKLKRKVNEKSFDFKFEKVSNISINDWVKVPNIYKLNKDYNFLEKWDNINTRIDKKIINPLHNNDFWWFIGLWLGDGWCESNGYKISIAFNKNEKEYINKCEQIVSNIFNRKCALRYSKKGNGVELSFCMKELSIFLTNTFGKYAKNKCIPEWVKKINQEYLQQIMLGYLDSDGCITKHTKGYNSMEFVSISLELLEGIQDIGLSIGLISNLSLLKKEGVSIIINKTVKTNKKYHLRFGNYDTISFYNLFNEEDKKSLKLAKIDIVKLTKRKTKGCFFDETQNYLFVQIKDITKSLYTGIVYNFECETNTFMTRFIPTHNCDPYNQSNSTNSSSLGTCVIFKRMYNLVDGTYQQRIVATYASRPNTIKEWNETVEKLLEYYNAIAMMENEGTTLLNHLDNKNKAHYLADGFSLLKEISPNTSILGRNKGLPATPPVIRHGMNLLIEYCKEEVLLGYDEENKPIMSLGVARISDPVLLKELIAYKKGANVDRIVAFRHALIYDKYLEKIFPIVSVQKEKKPMESIKEVRTPFTFGSSNPFGVGRRTPFSK